MLFRSLLTNDFFGPKIQLNAGSLTTKFSVDDSTPTAFTTMTYSGFYLGLAGEFPISEELPISLGGKLNFFVNPSLSESPSSGSSSNTVNSFSFFMDYRMKPRFKIRGELMFENYSSDFSGAGARATSISHKMTTLMGGVQYLF